MIDRREVQPIVPIVPGAGVEPSGFGVSHDGPQAIVAQGVCHPASVPKDAHIHHLRDDPRGIVQRLLRRHPPDVFVRHLRQQGRVLPERFIRKPEGNGRGGSRCQHRADHTGGGVEYKLPQRRPPAQAGAVNLVLGGLLALARHRIEGAGRFDERSEFVMELAARTGKRFAELLRNDAARYDRIAKKICARIGLAGLFI